MTAEVTQTTVLFRCGDFIRAVPKDVLKLATRILTFAGETESDHDGVLPRRVDAPCYHLHRYRDCRLYTQQKVGMAVGAFCCMLGAMFAAFTKYSKDKP